MTFKDHFSARAALYATYRPGYPEFLFEYLAGLTSRNNVVCDCATGSGQAAVGLNRHFGRVIAIDASRSQLRHAVRDGDVAYVAARAQELPLKDGSIDLITVAQALHWLDLEQFYQEVRRIVAPGGALAVWGYGDPVLDDPALNAIVHSYNRGTVEDYWLPERLILLDQYSTVPFPFREVTVPSFTLTCQWSLAELCGYLRTWSATAAYVAARGVDPVLPVEAALAKRWGPPETRQTVEWPLCLRVGYA